MQGTSKVCATCKQEKSLDDFSPRKNRPSGRHYSCKSCLAERAKKRRDLKPLSQDQRELARIRSVLWRLDNPERNKQIKSSWRLLNLSVKVAANRRRDSEKICRTPPWLSKQQKEEIKNIYWLARDLWAVTGEEYHVDHIVPLQGKTVCGLHVPWNLQILPKDLNLRKGNKF